jgi:hypothetical protein
MVEVKKSSLGFDTYVKFYESEKEADDEKGKVGAFKEEANNNLYYRGGCAQECREIIADVVEKATGIKRETQQVLRKVKRDGIEVEEAVKDKDGNPVLEYVLDEDPYVKKAMAAANMTVAQLQPAVTDALRAANGGQGVRVDIRTQEAKPRGPKTLPAKYALPAASLIESGKVTTFAKEYRKVMDVDLTDAQKTDANALGWALKEFESALLSRAIGLKK